jgi:hypothetical protein
VAAAVVGTAMAMVTAMAMSMAAITTVAVMMGAMVTVVVLAEFMEIAAMQHSGIGGNGNSDNGDDSSGDDGSNDVGVCGDSGGSGRFYGGSGAMTKAVM